MKVDELNPEMNITRLPGPFNYSIAIGSYSMADFHQRSQMGTLIHMMKYQHSTRAADRLASFLIGFIREYPLPQNPDLIITIPDSLPNRPFRPIAYLADAMAAQFGWTARHDIIHRVRLEKPQKSRSFEERLADDRPRYGIQTNDVIAGRTVLLFDDIYATGKSMIESAELIRGHKPSSIMALTLVRLGRDRDA